MRLHTRQGVLLVIAAAVIVVAAPLGFGAGEEQAERLGGLSYNDAYDQMTVKIDVFVRDQDGNPVTGLTREQFRFLQDGIEVPIEHFSAFAKAQIENPEPGSLTTAAAEAGEVEGPAGAAGLRPIYVILFIDNQHLRLVDRNRVLRALSPLVRSDLGGPTQIMVVANQQSLEIVQPFTDDHRALDAALRRLRMSEARLDERDKERVRIQREIRREEKSRHSTIQGRTKALSDLYDKIRTFAEEDEVVLEDTLLAIRSVTTALTGITDRKYLVYVSNGLPMALAADLLHQFAEVDSYSNGTALTLSYSKRRQYNALVAAINAQEITIHTIDATGSYSRASQLGDADSRLVASTAALLRENQQAPLRQMAEKTGGLAVLNTDDFEAGLGRIRAALQSYYSIGYVIDYNMVNRANDTDTVHLIDVEIDSEAVHEILYKKTLVERSIQSRVQDEVTSGLYFDTDHNPMNLEVTPSPLVQATEGRWQLPLRVLLPVTSVAMVRDQGEYVGRIVLFIAMRALDGSSSDLQRRAHTVRLAADEYERRKHENLPIFLQLLLGSGSHRIAIGAFDEVTHQTSSKRLQVDCPDEG